MADDTSTPTTPATPAWQLAPLQPATFPNYWPAIRQDQGYDNLFAQMQDSLRVPETYGGSWPWGNGAGRYAFGTGAPYGQPAGRNAPWFVTGANGLGGLLSPGLNGMGGHNQDLYQNGGAGLLGRPGGIGGPPTSGPINQVGGGQAPVIQNGAPASQAQSLVPGKAADAKSNPGVNNFGAIPSNPSAQFDPASLSPQDLRYVYDQSRNYQQQGRGDLYASMYPGMNVNPMINAGGMQVGQPGQIMKGGQQYQGAQPTTNGLAAYIQSLFR